MINVINCCIAILPATSASCSTDKVSARVNWLQCTSYNMLKMNLLPPTVNVWHCCWLI